MAGHRTQPTCLAAAQSLHAVHCRQARCWLLTGVLLFLLLLLLLLLLGLQV
jgi:hypothetical protein